MEAVRAFAKSFARAVVADDSHSISSYLFGGLEPAFTGVLDCLPRPMLKAEVLYVSAPIPEECVSLIAFAGPAKEPVSGLYGGNPRTNPR